MMKFLKLIHQISLSLFIGSIVTFVTISSVIQGATVESIALGRTIISTATNLVTMPGLWVLTITGLAMLAVRREINKPFYWIKMSIAFIVLLNAYLFVVPSASLATALANQSIEVGSLLSSYSSAYMNESIFGGINLLLALLASVIAVYRIGAK